MLGVYQNVSHHLDWIYSTMAQPSFCGGGARAEVWWCQCGRQGQELDSARVVGGREVSPVSVDYSIAIKLCSGPGLLSPT